MDTSKEQYGRIWYQDDKGNDIFVDEKLQYELDRPDNASILVLRDVNTIHVEYRKIIKQADVDACKHPAESVHATGGWVEGHEGRKCDDCGGCQSKAVAEEWPEHWDASSSAPLCSFRTSWNQDLVMAMVLSGDYTLTEAIIVSTSSCERCLNVLYYQYGLSDGYPEYSEEWKKAGTSCSYCEGPQVKTPSVSIRRIIRKQSNILHIQLNQIFRRFMRRKM